MKFDYLENDTYRFIGRLADVIHEQGIKISYSSLIQILKDNGLDDYGSERGMARGIAATWARCKEKEGIDSPICVAITETYVGADGEPSWIKYE